MLGRRLPLQPGDKACEDKPCRGEPDQCGRPRTRRGSSAVAWTGAGGPLDAAGALAQCKDRVSVWTERRACDIARSDAARQLSCTGLVLSRERLCRLWLLVPSRSLDRVKVAGVRQNHSGSTAATQRLDLLESSALGPIHRSLLPRLQDKRLALLYGRPFSCLCCMWHSRSQGCGRKRGACRRVWPNSLALTNREDTGVLGLCWRTLLRSRSSCEKHFTGAHRTAQAVDATGQGTTGSQRLRSPAVSELLRASARLSVIRQEWRQSKPHSSGDRRHRDGAVPGCRRTGRWRSWDRSTAGRRPRRKGAFLPSVGCLRHVPGPSAAERVCRTRLAVSVAARNARLRWAFPTCPCPALPPSSLDAARAGVLSHPRHASIRAPGSSMSASRDRSVGGPRGCERSILIGGRAPAADAAAQLSEAGARLPGRASFHSAGRLGSRKRIAERVLSPLSAPTRTSRGSTAWGDYSRTKKGKDGTGRKCRNRKKEGGDGDATGEQREGGTEARSVGDVLELRDNVAVQLVEHLEDGLCGRE